MEYLEEYLQEFPEATPEDIIWVWLTGHYQAVKGDEKILWDALNKVWTKYMMDEFRVE